MSLPATVPPHLHQSSSTASSYSCLTAFFPNYSTDDRKATFTLPVFPILAWHLLLRCQSSLLRHFLQSNCMALYLVWVCHENERVAFTEANVLQEMERNNQLFLFNFCSVALIMYTGNWNPPSLSLSLALGSPGSGKLFNNILWQNLPLA